MPNPGILIDTLALQEAKASSEIENIVTTQDEMFQASLFPEGPISPAAKEVARYAASLKRGFDRMRENQGLITNNLIIEIFQSLKGTDGGFRKTLGTTLTNDVTGEIVFVPLQDANDILKAMTALESFINDEPPCSLDPLIKMALIHHQFESIHPFPDGNGRIGRILNVLYLTKERLLTIPILYLSRYITANKAVYYRLLQAVRDEGAWVEWVLFMLEAVTQTAAQTLELIDRIHALMLVMKHKIRSEHPKLYSQDLLNNLFRHPYTRIEYLKEELGVTRQTASAYLNALHESGYIRQQKVGRTVYFINAPLLNLFLDGKKR